MNTIHLQKQFGRMGARLKLTPFLNPRQNTAFSVDIRRDDLGPFFDISAGKDIEDGVEVLDLQAEQRHLLLLIRDLTGKAEMKHKFLCGHDERDWFVAAVPEISGVSSVRTAMEALKPAEVLAAQTRKNVKTQLRNRRRNDAFIRQGEWFFIPEPDMHPPRWMILRSEPLLRGRGKPHLAEFVYRFGGTTVYVSRQHPNGLSEENYRRMVQAGQIVASDYQVRRLNPEVYAKGRVTHADHKTVMLHDWCRVVPNTENRAASMKHLAFID